MAKKMDRFGWERDRGTAAHDRLLTDWMDALRDYPLDEVKDACRRWVIEAPRKMPNEGDILAIIEKARRLTMLAHQTTDTRPATREENEAILAEIAESKKINPERAAQADAIIQGILGRKP